MQKRAKFSPAGVGSVGKISAGLLLPILIGFFLGNYLDERLGTAPWLTLCLLLSGIIAGLGWLYRISSHNE